MDNADPAWRTGTTRQVASAVQGGGRGSRQRQDRTGDARVADRVLVSAEECGATDVRGMWSHQEPDEARVVGTPEGPDSSESAAQHFRDGTHDHVLDRGEAHAPRS